MDKNLVELNGKAKETGAIYPQKRPIYQKIRASLSDRIFLGIIGPRGVGKTILLKQLLSEPGIAAFYISLDDIPVDFSLYEAANELVAQGVQHLLLDEIQFYPLFDRDMKKIFDNVPQIKIIFTGSMALALAQSAYDLARRVLLINMPPPSLREFITFQKNIAVGSFPFSDLMDTEKARNYYGHHLFLEPYFENYLKGLHYPFASGSGDYLRLFGNILEKIISNDLLKSGSVTFDELRDIRNVVTFIGKSPAEGINYSSVAQNCGLPRTKAEKYVSLLERSFVLNVVPPKGTNVLKEPKILLSLPYRLLYKNFDDCIGALREDFFVDAMRFSGKEIFYLKSTRGEKTPDYLVDDLVIEIGGKSKGRSQFKGYKAMKKIILTHPGTIDEMRRPLFLLGMVEF